MLTEAEVHRSFRKMMTGDNIPADVFDKAEELIDKLRYESPLRHRLSIELEEIRKLQTGSAKA